MRLRSLHGLWCGFPARFNCRPIASYRSSVSCSESCCSCRINSVLVSFNDAPIAPQSCVRALRTCSALRVWVLLTVLFGCRRRCFLGSHMLHWPGGVSRFRGATTHGKLPPYVFDQRPRKKKSNRAQSSRAQGWARMLPVRVFFLHVLQQVLSCCLDTRDTSYVIIEETHA
jgi:hypothetical protein